MDYTEKYKKLLDKSEETGLPKYFLNDLRVHDLRFLKENNPDEFIWVLRTAGTHLFTIPEAKKYRSQVCEIADNEVRFFWFSGGELTEKTRDEVTALLREPVSSRTPFSIW